MATFGTDLQESIGYRFQNEELLLRALTHRSAEGENNERLEFLGDSILNVAISVGLFQRFPEIDEGLLTRCRARLVRQKTLAEAARNIGLNRFILLGDGAVRSGGADRDSILADVVEALIGAVYLEAGFDLATTVVKKLLQQEWESIDPTTLVKDPKTQLQEQLQKGGHPLPKYEIKETRGDPHQREFLVECILETPASHYCGKGSSRQKAEQNAAQLALYELTGRTSNVE